ncbi:MAG: acyl-CoA dehydrogenase family protein [Sphingomonadaceae bacterium]
MSDKSFLGWPFFEDRHRELGEAIEGWCGDHLGAIDDGDVDAACRELVRRLGDAGWLRHCVPDAEGRIDVRSICLIRETLARHHGLADYAFAMQGLGSGTPSLFGSEKQKAAWLPRVAAGEAIAAFALTEPGSGSDVAAMETAARRDGEEWVLDGAKTYISNGGIADFHTVFARTGGEGAKGISAFLLPADTAGLDVSERIEVIAPHPLATLRFKGARLPAGALIGEEGSGFAQAMAVLDLFRPTVGAAALGFARRALDEATARAKSRRLFGKRLAENEVVQAQLAEMALDIDAAALLVYRAAWVRDNGAARTTREAAMAKLFATEAAQRVIDTAVQIFGGLGVTRGVPVERLYREIRALRIYEGASEVQRLVIARRHLEGEGP